MPLQRQSRNLHFSRYENVKSQGLATDISARTDCRRELCQSGGEAGGEEAGALRVSRDAQRCMGGRHAEGEGEGLHGDDTRRRAIVREVRAAGERRWGGTNLVGLLGQVSAASSGRGVRRQDDAGGPARGPQGQQETAVHPLHRHAQLGRELRHHRLRQRGRYPRSRLLSSLSNWERCVASFCSTSSRQKFKDMENSNELNFGNAHE